MKQMLGPPGGPVGDVGVDELCEQCEGPGCA